MLIVGCGDIGARVGEQLMLDGWRVSALRRDPARLPAGFVGYAGDYSRDDGLRNLTEVRADVVLFTPLPADREVAGYERGFRDSVDVIAASGVLATCRRFLYVSSTRVYAEQSGAWVDEAAALTQRDPRGIAIAQGEQRARQQTATTVVRPAGVYGASPAMLLERVAGGAGSADPERISNRIHRDDLAGLLALLAVRALDAVTLPDVVNAADNEPAPIGEVEAWLASAIGVALAPGAGGKSVRGNRRVANRRLHELGYQLQYPSWREGYAALIANWRDQH